MALTDDKFLVVQKLHLVHEFGKQNPTYKSYVTYKICLKSLKVTQECLPPTVVGI